MRRIHNPPNPYDACHLEWEGEPPPAELEVYEEQARTALTKNESPDVGFRWSLNPYRGCFHGCAYCYARPSHQYWGLGAGTDFERRIIVRTNVADKLREALGRRSWKGETIVFSGNTDCYQPLEASYGLTRACLQVCLEHRNPVAIITKGRLVIRDVELLASLAKRTRCRVIISVPFADDAMAKHLEPFASPTSKRLETLRSLSEAGVPTGVSLAPVIPGLNDGDAPTILKRARDAGADVAFMTLVRLSREVQPVFLARLAQAYPARVDKVTNALLEMRDGKLNESRFGARMRGQGERWRMIEETFELHRRRLGMEPPASDEPSPLERPGAQLSLFPS